MHTGLSHLCSGLGNDAGLPAATFVEGHVRSFHALRRPHKRWGKKGPPLVQVSSTVGKELSRYLEASRGFLATCTSLSVACDASRVGGKDVLLVAILGIQSNGCAKVLWAPPQVTCSCVGQGMTYT